MPGALIPLAVLAAVTSPTAIAAVLVILNRPRPVALLAGYAAGSFVMSLLIGIAIVAGLTATTVFAPRHRASLPVLDLTVGVLILISAAWLRSPRSADLRGRASARRARRQAEKAARSGGEPNRSWQMLTRGSIGLVAAVGAAMHLPGLLYLAALGQVAHAGLSASHALVVLVLFNVVMLAPIELPLVGCLVAPEQTQNALEHIDAYIREHRMEGLLLGSALAAGYLIVSGIVGLAG